MGKGTVKKRLIKKLEYFLLIAFPLSIYFFYHENPSEKVEFLNKATEKIQAVDFSTKNVSAVFDDQVFLLMYKMIRDARETIFISTYTIRKNRLMDILEKKHTQGVKVVLAYGKSKDGYVPSFSLEPVIKNYGIFHSKFIVTDSENVLITSTNIGSDSSAVNNAVLFRNARKAAAILEKEVEGAVEGKLPKRCDKGCDTEIGRVFFTPGKACVNIKKEFLKASSGIEGGIYTITTKNPVMTGLKKVLKKKNIRVRLIADNWKGDNGRLVNKKALNYLESMGADVKYDSEFLKKDPLFHHKFAVVDGKTTVFGSLNWTSSGCYKNREIIVINKNEKIAEKFSEYFSTIWKN